jgi:hypothetical protein
LVLARPASILQEYGPMMRDLEAWQYDEFRQMGRDYGNPAEVEIYDSIHAGFRDVEAESNQVLDLLVLASSDVLMNSDRERGHLPWLPRAAVPACMRSMFLRR